MSDFHSAFLQEVRRSDVVYFPKGMTKSFASLFIHNWLVLEKMQRNLIPDKIQQNLVLDKMHHNQVPEKIQRNQVPDNMQPNLVPDKMQ